jgi:hypothetical protein
VSFVAITLCVASQRVFIIVVYFVIDSVRKLLDTPSCLTFGSRILFSDIQQNRIHLEDVFLSRNESFNANSRSMCRVSDITSTNSTTILPNSVK